jgi:hypothetical protein
MQIQHPSSTYGCNDCETHFRCQLGPRYQRTPTTGCSQRYHLPSQYQLAEENFVSFFDRLQHLCTCHFQLQQLHSVRRKPESEPLHASKHSTENEKALEMLLEFSRYEEKVANCKLLAENQSEDVLLPAQPPTTASI